ncbi:MULTISPECIES: hypothetical protein [unclassified Streptomyces]|uniref:hypothetical protein n=1 Tax=unclassified Streptomyces TaxID=2593676 RepID=UPI0035D8E87E
MGLPPPARGQHGTHASRPPRDTPPHAPPPAEPAADGCPDAVPARRGPAALRALATALAESTAAPARPSRAHPHSPPPALARARALRSPLGAVSRVQRAAARGGRPPWGGLDAVASRAADAVGEILPARGGPVALRALVTVPAEGATDPARATRVPARALALATRAPARRLRLTAAPPNPHARPAEPPALRTPVESSPKGPAPR